MQSNDTVTGMSVEEIRFKTFDVDSTVLHEPRCYAQDPSGHFVPSQIPSECQIEHCSNRLIRKNSPSEEITAQTMTMRIFREDGTATWIFAVPQMREFRLLTQALQEKMRFGKPNVFHVNFASIQLLQRSVCERITCICASAGSSDKNLDSLNPVWK